MSPTIEWKNNMMPDLNMETLIADIRRYAQDHSFSGVVSLSRGKTARYNEAFGYADVANGRKNTVTTKFGIASGTKFFTALGIGCLIAQGRLTLDCTVHDIFQEDLTWIDARATVGHLLTHTSGIYDYYDEEVITDFDNFFVEIPWYQLTTPSDYLPLFQQKTPKFAPGERFSYSNGGYICLGIIIERLSGQCYREFVEANVFTPAGMSDSGYYAFNQLPANTANGYKMAEDGHSETNIYNLPVRGASDGGAYTTTQDLHAFWHALAHHAILPPELTTLFLTPQVKINPSISYGYGVYLAQLHTMKVLRIVGGDAGVGFDSRYIPEQDLVVTILANTTNGEEGMRNLIAGHLHELF